ncbi:hypothetical protein [Heliomarina baculiformis]|uniref:hypothetical protein n=1 Tax=Heliomarina baculiformis TaxID=2872036 RepID=UPI001EE3226D|nr:hypothetical protein [Heliomarina baculiformis]
MNDFQWRYLGSGLGLREDAYSWQGSFLKDGRFFTRRSKDKRNLVSDLLFGDLADQTVGLLLSEFLSQTGGVDTGQALIFEAIAGREDEKQMVVERFDRIVNVAKASLATLNLQVEDAMLDEYRGKWRAVISIK